MIVIGAKGLAKEILEIFTQKGETENLYFFDNLSPERPEKLFGKFRILHSIDQAKKTFHELNDFSFTLGLGKPQYRLKFFTEFTELGGCGVSAISIKADIGSYDTVIQQGCSILSGVVITNNVKVGKGCLINPNCTISHDSEIGDYVEMGPGVSVTGNCKIGDFCVLGTNSVILPGIKLGKNVIVGAGAVVTKNVPDNSLVAGVPATLKRKLDVLPS
jgi:sugar O-acyltransferase (sialic acid O-acetyltransferase NeuD family)